MPNRISREKDEIIDQLIKKLKPNTYTEEHSIWNDLNAGLSKLSFPQLNALYCLILCRKED